MRVNIQPSVAMRRAWAKYNRGIRIISPPIMVYIGNYTPKGPPKMADIFDATRRKISKHISKEIAPEVFAEKKADFKAKVELAVMEYLASPKCSKRIMTYIEYEARENIKKYFCSREFKKKCQEVAKGMVK